VLGQLGQLSQRFAAAAPRSGPASLAAAARALTTVVMVPGDGDDDAGDAAGAGDDDGHVHIVDLGGGKVARTLKGAHANICSGVRFRAHRPHELLTGGMDCRWAGGRGGAGGSCSRLLWPAARPCPGCQAPSAARQPLRPRRRRHPPAPPPPAG
jgi:hypothetical protein